MNTERIIADAHLAATALRELLANTTVDHLSGTLERARLESKSPNELEGSFWWMQNHYQATAAAVNAAYVIAWTIETLVAGLAEQSALAPSAEQEDSDNA